MMDRVPQKARFYIALTVTAAIAVFAFSIIFFGVYQVYFVPAALFNSDFSEVSPVEEEFGQKVVNVAVLGLHNRNEDNTFGEIYFVDTILVVSINFDTNSLALLAVPRDSYVLLAKSEVSDRIRQSYSYGFHQETADPHAAGLKAALDTLDSILDGVKIHHYLAMDLQGLRELIDSMGGVNFTVEEDLIGFTPRESLKAGPQQLDGRGYVTYLTYREEDTRDDLNRMKRQKDLLLATFMYFKEMGLFSYVIPTYTAYREHIRTDLSFNQVAALAFFAGERLESDAIKDYSLTGEYFSPDEGETYFLALDEEANKLIIEHWAGR
ncbi:MAG: LytR family transcriptional regulator [Firmicutes bacterium]|nr:LytR family transcriptional regulator [Bacillota bacterium]